MKCSDTRLHFDKLIFATWVSPVSFSPLSVLSSHSLLVVSPYIDINRTQKPIFCVFSLSEEILQVHEDRETMKKGKSVQIARPVRKIITTPRETETGDDPLLAQIQEKSAKVSWT